MEQLENQLRREKFSCSICLDLLKEPVTVQCGHSYCLRCIENHWDTQKGRGSYDCPQCMRTFAQRPELQKNIMLADLAEELRKTAAPEAAREAAPADSCCAGPATADVFCDVCTDHKYKAAKSCLVCLASYCEQHLQAHIQSPPLMKHKLMEPREKLQENICPLHEEAMRMFCRTDQQCICYLCSVEGHKGHDTVSAAAERTEKQRELGATRQQIQKSVQDREAQVTLLQQEAMALNESADNAREQSEEIFTELIRQLRQKSSQVNHHIGSQQETENGRIKGLQEKLMQEITELKKKDAQLTKLEHTQDHTYFLHRYPSLSMGRKPKRSVHITIRPRRYFEDVTAAVSKVRDQILDIVSESWTNISLSLINVDVLLQEPQPKTKAEFLKYSKQITLDPNTANKQLILSEGNRKVRYVRRKESYPAHPDRFTDYAQVLSTESLTGRHYWEVEWRGDGVGIAVAYKSISRTGETPDCLLGSNDKSWMLVSNENNFIFYHNKTRSALCGPVSSRVGVYLDSTAGVLSFYSVSDSMTLLHRVRTTFTQPLHVEVGFTWMFDSTAEFCK